MSSPSSQITKSYVRSPQGGPKAGVPRTPWVPGTLAEVKHTGRGEGLPLTRREPERSPGAWGPPYGPPPSSRTPAPFQSKVGATGYLEQVPKPQGEGWREAAEISQGPRTPPREAGLGPQGPQSRGGLETRVPATVAASAGASAQTRNRLATACAPGLGALCRRPPSGFPPSQGA